MIRIKFSAVSLPFPDTKGYWLRTVFRRNSIIKGSLMLMDGDLVILMENEATTTPEVLRRGDQLCFEGGDVVVYTKIEQVALPARTTPPDLATPPGPDTASQGH